jgi:hypothetical protein
MSHSLYNIINNVRLYTGELEQLSQYSVWLQTGRPRDRGSIPGRGERSLCVQTSSDAYPASYPKGIGVLSPRVKRGRGATLTTHPPI